MPEQIFKTLAAKATTDKALIETLWQEISDAYGQSARHYHNLRHLENIIAELEGCHGMIKDYDTALYSVFYHDLVYDVLRQDNEEQSALRAVACMQQLGLSEAQQQRCAARIRATQAHAIDDDANTNLFTDADLAILGYDEQAYQRYCKQVRAEYAVYPDALYLPGRSKVLQHFLDMDRIFKTDFFYNRYEAAARRNLAAELEITGCSYDVAEM